MMKSLILFPSLRRFSLALITTGLILPFTLHAGIHEVVKVLNVLIFMDILFLKFLFTYFCLCWVFVSEWTFSLAVASEVRSSDGV